MPTYFPAMLLFTGNQWRTPKPLPKISGDRPQIRKVSDKVQPFQTKNLLYYSDKDRAIFRPKNPLFSGQTYGGASGGLLRRIGDPGLARAHPIVVAGSPLSKLSARVNKFPIILRVIICKITLNQRDKHSCKPIRFSSKFRSLGSRRVFVHYAMPTRTTIVASCSSDSIPAFPHLLNVRKINEGIRKSKPCLILNRC
jgi:hypothetical protein